jgi:hypothetical protein
MNYRDVFYSRINHLGNTTAERIRQGGIRSFEKWLAESPHTVRRLYADRQIYFDAIILTNKDKEYQKIMFLNVANTIPLVIGDIINWRQDNGNIEKWIIFQETHKVNGTYRTFWIVKCNYLLKWIDKLGHLQQSWAYVVSSTDDKIKGNFRTWNSLITPQPNKYAEILMPRYPIERSTNFIIEQESWSIVEYDHTSVPGIIYLSLTENKVNLIYDDLEKDIADTDKMAQYELVVPEEKQVFKVGDIITPAFNLTKNGIPISLDVKLLSTDRSIVTEVNNRLTAVHTGEVKIIVQSIQFPQIQKDLFIVVKDEEDTAFSAYLSGAATIRLDRIEKYELVGTTDLNEEEVIFTIDSNLASIVNISNNKCEIRANDLNRLGSFTLSATYKNVTYTKNIQVIPLW